jgi:signal peptidase I
MDFGILLLGLTALAGLIWGLGALWGRFRRRHTNVIEPEPAMVDWARSLFPVLLIVLLLRSFLGEPFRIPSGSMMPTVNAGDFIVVNKFAYGLRVPGLNTRFAGTHVPQRGDVVVFRFPGYLCPSGATQVRSGDPTCAKPNTPVPLENWIKRVIGVPGDRVGMEGDQLTINGQPVTATRQGVYTGNPALPDAKLLLDHQATVWTEALPGPHGPVTHPILRMDHPTIVPPSLPNPLVSGVVPPGCYLMLGDDRYNSLDGRWWGCVPEANLVGQAYAIWLSFPGPKAGWVDFKRTFTRIH